MGEPQSPLLVAGFGRQAGFPILTGADPNRGMSDAR